MRAPAKRYRSDAGMRPCFQSSAQFGRGIPEREPRRIGKANDALRAEIGGAGLDPYPSDPTYIPKRGAYLVEKGVEM